MTAHSASALSIRDLTVAYLDKPVLWDIDLDIRPGKLCAIVGPNGAGKSTLIKAVLGLVPVSSGTIEVLGHKMPQARKLCAYVPQRSEVDWDFPINVFDVVLMGTYPSLGWFRRPGKAEKELAMSAIEQVGMADYAKTQISQLSGGQQQRVFFARAIAQNTQIAFLDEPMAGVDAATESRLVAILQAMRDDGKTVIVVHHDIDSVKSDFDEVVLLNKQVLAQGEAEATLSESNLHQAYGDKAFLAHA